MIRKVVGLNFKPIKETAEIIEGVSKDIARKLNDVAPLDIAWEMYDLEDVCESDDLHFDSETVVVLGVPAVRGKIPMESIRMLQNLKGNGTLSVAVVTYDGNGYGKSLYELYSYVESQGFYVVSAAAFVAKELKGKMTRKLSASRPDDKDLEMMKLFSGVTGNKIKRLCGTDCDHLKVKPAALNINCYRRGAIRTIADLIKRNEADWYI